MIPNLTVPTLTRYDLLGRLLDSLDFPIRHLLIVDNGGGLQLDRDLPTVERVTVLRMPANLGVAGSWNLAVKSFPFDPAWFICSDDVVFSPGSLELWLQVSGPDRFVSSDEWPFYQFFSIGEEVVGAVGLWDEAIFPANFEDDDMEWRAGLAGFPVKRATIPHGHTKHGTVFQPGFAHQNARTYPHNEAYFRGKVEADDRSAGQWSLSRRRTLHWESLSD
jgi:GT2 family glycosyltransferase